MSSREEFSTFQELQFQLKDKDETINRLGSILKTVMTELYQLKHKED
jgi:hypothetical protein